MVVTDAGGGSLQATLYIDGQDEGSDTGTQIDRSFWNHALHIGAGDAAGRKFDGQIDDARIYNRALSPVEIAALWNGPTGGILENDSDIEGDVLSATLVSGPGNGTLGSERLVGLGELVEILALKLFEDL